MSAAHRLPARHHVVGLERGFGGDLERILDRLARPMALVAPVIDRPVVRDPEQPRPQVGQRLHVRELVVRPGERVLDHVFAVGDRAGYARAVAMQLRPDAIDELQELPSPLLERADELARRRVAG